MAEIGIDTSGLENVQFGTEIREKEFCLSPKTGILNSGSYGNTPRRVLEMQKRYLDEMESQPDHWFRRKVFPKWNKSREAVADLVGADVEDLVFMTNTTSGVNTVLRSLKLGPGDAILASSLTYGALLNLWEDFTQNISPGVEGLMIEIKMPIVSEDSVVQQYDDYLTQHPNVKFVLIHHITSASALLLPVKRLISVCRKHGALVMVDGAHAPGQLPLNLRELDADFYAGNLNKWIYTPKGCGMLWIKREHQSVVKPPVTSWELGKSLPEQFFNQGTRDLIPFVCVKDSLRFYEAIGGIDKVVGYTSDLATKAQDLLAKELGLERLDVPASMESPNMRLLKMPGVPRICLATDMRNGIVDLMEDIYAKYDLQTAFDVVDDAVYFRISIQVYNTLEECRRLVPALKRVMEDCEPYKN